MVYAYLFPKQCFVAKKFKKRWYWAILAITKVDLPKFHESACLSSLFGPSWTFDVELALPWIAIITKDLDLALPVGTV